MDKCEKFQEMISEMLDGCLPSAEQEALHAHLAACPDCRRVRDAFAAISGAEELEEPPVEMLEGAMFRIRAQAARRSTRKKWNWKQYAAMAACLAIVVFGASRLPLMGASSENTTAPAAMDMELMCVESYYHYADDRSMPAVTSDLPAAAPEPAPAETSKPADTSAPVDANAGEGAVVIVQLQVLNERGEVYMEFTDPAELAELEAQLRTDGEGYAVRVQYADGLSEEFILPFDALD